MVSSYIYLVIAMLTIQFGASVAKGLFIDLGPAGTTALRVFFSALILTGINRPYKNRQIYKEMILDKKYFSYVLLFGSSLGLMNLFFYYSLQRIPLGLAVTLEFIGPLAVSFFYARNIRDYSWALFAGLGICLLFYKSYDLQIDIIGMIFALIAGFFWALYIVFGKKITFKNINSRFVISLSMICASLVTLPVGLWLNFEKVVNPNYWISGIFVALLSSAIPYSLELKAMKNIPEKTFGILMSFEPVIAILIGLIFLKEYLDPFQIIAIFLVIIACVGSTIQNSPNQSGK